MSIESTGHGLFDADLDLLNLSTQGDNHVEAAYGNSIYGFEAVWPSYNGYLDSEDIFDNQNTIQDIDVHEKNQEQASADSKLGIQLLALQDQVSSLESRLDQTSSRMSDLETCMRDILKWAIEFKKNADHNTRKLASDIIAVRLMSERIS